MALSRGTRLGPYEILRPLGSGGMGEVYRARDATLGRDIALKLLHTSDAPNDSRVRLLREARAAASLNHPAICTIHEVGEERGVAYIAMELIEGQSLSARCSAGPLPADEVVRYGVSLADAVGHAHDRGIVHRDLKSANVMITSEGRIKVLDFGLATRLSGPEFAEATTAALSVGGGRLAFAGTIPYMAPELLRGQPADTRSDVWALGIILYEMAAGARPFRGDTNFEISSAIFHEAPLPIPDLPPTLHAVMLRCLEKDPARRYQRAGEVRAALEGFIARPVRSKHGLSVAALSLLLALGTAVGVALWTARTRAPIRSLAVLPLENLSRDPAQDYVAAGVHEALITDLAQIGLDKVIAKPSADAFKGTTKPLKAIGRELGVEGLITGSVLRLGDRIQISAQLVNAESGAIVWAKRYDRSAGDVLSLQNDVVNAIAREIQAKLTPAQVARLTTARPVIATAHDAYVKGKALDAAFSNNPDPSRLSAIIAQYEQATRLDPQYASPYAAMSLAYQTAAQISFSPPKDAYPKARTAAEKAIALDDGLAEAHSALGGVKLWYEWAWDDAQREIDRALRLNPDSPNALTTSEVYLTLVSGSADEAARISQRILDVDPLNPFSRVQPVWVALFSRRYDDSIQHAKSLLQAWPDNLMGPWFLSTNYAVKRMGDDVRRECSRVVAMLGGAYVLQPIANCAWALGTVGATEDARRLIRILEQPPPGTWLDPIIMAQTYGAVGDLDRAIEWAQKGLDERAPNMIYLKSSVTWDFARSDPRFQAIVRQMHFPE